MKDFDFTPRGVCSRNIHFTLDGTTIRGVTIRSMDELDAYVAQFHPDVAVLTVPQHVAQSLADQLVTLGIKGFWNFTNVELSTAEPGVFFEDIHFVDTLLTLSYRISRQG